MNKRTNIIGTLLVILLIGTAVVANEKVAEYRHHSMEAVEVHFQSILQIMDGEIPFQNHLSMHVNALADYGTIMPDLFADGSEGGEALDRIWEEDEKEDFQKAIDVFNGAMLKLKTVVDDDDSDAIPAAVRDVGNACRGCHRRYRE
ncbi:MAG: cytochrome c [Gammaproteobacteria bacterium]|nr:cytochrome c [Gammaproteobacteria bacterium]MYF37879.1 cytochrome c [Gammaproteobacteria bacterium]